MNLFPFLLSYNQFTIQQSGQIRSHHPLLKTVQRLPTQARVKPKRSTLAYKALQRIWPHLPLCYLRPFFPHPVLCSSHISMVSSQVHFIFFEVFVLVVSSAWNILSTDFHTPGRFSAFLSQLICYFIRKAFHNYLLIKNISTEYQLHANIALDAGGRYSILLVIQEIYIKTIMKNCITAKERPKLDKECHSHMPVSMEYGKNCLQCSQECKLA